MCLCVCVFLCVYVIESGREVETFFTIKVETLITLKPQNSDQGLVLFFRLAIS